MGTPAAVLCRRYSVSKPHVRGEGICLQLLCSEPFRRCPADQPCPSTFDTSWSVALSVNTKTTIWIPYLFLIHRPQTGAADRSLDLDNRLLVEDENGRTAKT